MNPFRRLTLHDESVAATSTDAALQLVVTALKTGRWHDANANVNSSQVRHGIESFDRYQHELSVI